VVENAAKSKQDERWSANQSSANNSGEFISTSSYNERIKSKYVIGKNSFDQN